MQNLLHNALPFFGVFVMLNSAKSQFISLCCPGLQAVKYTSDNTMSYVTAN